MQMRMKRREYELTINPEYSGLQTWGTIVEILRVQLVCEHWVHVGVFYDVCNVRVCVFVYNMHY